MRAPTICAAPGCPEEATHRGRCARHQRQAWQHRSPSSIALNGPERATHRRARRAAHARSKGRCERCGDYSTELALHHPHHIADGGAVEQPDAPLLCPACHKLEHHSR